MTQLQKFSQIANQLSEDEPEAPFAPIPWWSRNTSIMEYGGYVCRENGIGCIQAFPTKEAKSEHRLGCKYVTYRESERAVSLQRLMGG